MYICTHHLAVVVYGPIGNDNQKALGIEARKNENRQWEKGKEEKKDQVLGSFRDLGRGKVRLHNAVFRRILRTVHKC